MRTIHNTAQIADNVIIEDNVYIGPYCIIGFPPEWKGREKDNKGVVIKQGTRITGLVTIDGGAEKPTIIGENCYLMKTSHIGHDCEIGNNVTISCGVKVGGHCVIGDNTNLGLNAVIHQKVNIPKGVMIGASSFVGKKSVIEANKKYAGVPVKYLGENVKI